MRVTRSRSTAVLATVALLLASPLPAGVAVNADHGAGVVSDDPANHTPHVMNGAVLAITQVGGTVVAAGTFTSVSPAGTFDDTSDDVVRNRIFAFDAATGEIDPDFDPNIGGEVRSLDTDGTHVYAGGVFGSVGGDRSVKRVVKLTAAGSVVPEFRTRPSSRVNEVVVRGSRLYLGGQFTTVKSGGTTFARGALAAVNTSTGAVLNAVDLPFTGVYDPANDGGGTTNIKRMDLTADGSRLVAIGNFARVAGQPRAQVAVLDTGAAPATLAPWATDRFARSRNTCAKRFDSFVRDVDFSPGGAYFVVTTTAAFAGGAARATMCDTISRWSTTSSGNEPSWVNYTGGDTTYGVAITGGVVYVGGHMRWVNNPFQGDQAGPGAVAREGIVALDPVNGLPLSWNPGRTRGVGAQALLATSAGLWVGSDTTRFANERRGRIAFLPLGGGTAVPASPSASLPHDLFLAQRSGAGSLLRRAVNGSGAPTGPATTVNSTIDWSTIRGGFLLGDRLYHGSTDGRLYRRAFDVATGATGTAQAVDLHDDPDTGVRIPFAISSMSGSFFDPATHRLYYTVAGDSRLFYRYFTPESEVVGAETFQASTNGVSFAATAGMTLASGRILYGSTDGSLRSVSFSGGRVTGSPAVVSNDGTWSHRAMLVPTD